MTNWDKMKDAIHLMHPYMEAEDFADMQDNYSSCPFCGLEDRCDKKMYLTDENGKFVKDEQNYLVFRENSPTCKEVVLEWLMEEAES